MQKVSIFANNSISLWDLIKIYSNGLYKANLGNRAAAISWRLFMSLFPFLLFFLVLLQYLPYYAVIQDYLVDEVIQNLLPPNVVDTTSTYIKERQNNISKELEDTSFWVLGGSMLLFLYISTNGINSLIKGLQISEKTLGAPKRKVKTFLNALFLTLFLTIILFISLLSIYYIDVIWSIIAQENFDFHFDKAILKSLKYLLNLLLFFIGICSIYFKGSSLKLSIKQILPGAILSTFLLLVITFLFGIYITQFTRYNLLYGSLGSVLIIMLGLYLYVTLILIGHELNISLAKAKKI